jgi:excisionase family DNA binding protein
MEDKLLSIGEAAKLIGVCENTLRDWDIENKFKATRTSGGHRRYSLDQIRSYLEANPSQKEESPSIFSGRRVDKIEEKWANSEYLSGIEDEQERINLSVLLENTRFHHEVSHEAVLSSSQTLWLVAEAWKRLRFRKMVSVQTMRGPCDLIYSIRHLKNGNSVIDSNAVAALTHKYDFSIFPKANFENVKELYADAMAQEIDNLILYHLPRSNADSLMDLVKNSGLKVRDAFDYVIGYESIINSLRDCPAMEGVELYSIPTILDPTSFVPIVAGGRYPKSSMKLPVFFPYLLFVTTPVTTASTISVHLRFGWGEGK